MAPPAHKQGFWLAVAPRGGGALLKLSGVIDETFSPHQLLEAARGKVVLDLDGVKRITSFGVREWVNAMLFSGNGKGGVAGWKLLANMDRPADHYLANGTRDFFEIDGR